MRTRQRLATTAGVLGTIGVLAGGLTATAQAQDNQSTRAECTPHALPVPAGTGKDVSVDLMGVDPSGRYVLGQIWSADPDGQGWLWADGEFETKLAGLEPPHPDGWNEFRDVNGSGVVVGVMAPGNDGWTPWKYENGTYTKLPGANDVEAINENGDILGTEANQRTVAWLGGTPGNRVDMKGMIVGNDISEATTVVGYDHDDTSAETPYYWPDPNSAPRELDNPAGVEASIPSDIAGDWVVGSDRTNDDGGGVLWNLADGTAERLPYYPSSVNGDGDIGTDGTIHRADGSTLELPAPDGSVSSTPYVHTVTGRGSKYAAVGEYEIRADVYRPVAWTC